MRLLIRERHGPDWSCLACRLLLDQAVSGQQLPSRISREECLGTSSPRSFGHGCGVSAWTTDPAQAIRDLFIALDIDAGGSDRQGAAGEGQS